MKTELLRHWMTLNDRKRSLEAELDEVKAEMTSIDGAVKDEFANSGVDSVSINGRTMSIRCDRWPVAKDGNRAALAAALKVSGFQQYVKEDFNQQSLRSLTNEMIRNHLAELTDAERVTFNANDAIPESLRPFLEIDERFTVTATK